MTRAPLVLAAGHKLEVVRPDAGRQPAGMVRLVPGRDPPAVMDLPRDVVAAANLLPYSHYGIAVFIDGACHLQQPAGVLTQLRISFSQRVTGEEFSLWENVSDQRR
jgi:hypothetical protein